MYIITTQRQTIYKYDSGADPGFPVRGTHLKKMRRAEGGAKMFGVFRVKNHDFTPKNHIFSTCGGRHENFRYLLNPRSTALEVSMLPIKPTIYRTRG
jgi:hypothetical protein